MERKWSLTAMVRVEKRKCGCPMNSDKMGNHMGSMQQSDSLTTVRLPCLLRLVLTLPQQLLVNVIIQ
jgi:hypothetical protein